MAAKDSDRCEHEGDRPNEPAQPGCASQFWHEPLGLSAGSRCVKTQRTLAARHLRRRVVLHTKHSILPWNDRAIEGPRRRVRGALELQREARLWASLDGNFWFGGATTLNGVTSPQTSEKNSRVGGTVSVPLNAHQSIKRSY